MEPTYRAVQAPEEDFELPEDMELDDGDARDQGEGDDGSPPDKGPEADDGGGDFADAGAEEGPQPPRALGEEETAPGAPAMASLR